MANLYGVPGYSVQDVAHMRAQGSALILLDVREVEEIVLANLGPEVVQVPLSDLAASGLAALPEAIMSRQDTEIIVFCHHGARSAQVTAWLRAGGFDRAINMDGGIDAYARLVDKSIGVY